MILVTDAVDADAAAAAAAAADVTFDASRSLTADSSASHQFHCYLRHDTDICGWL